MSIEGAHRFAVYYAPAQASPLARFGAQWLGWDPVDGRRVAHPDAPPLTAADIARFTETPRRYGFHGTLKAPFRLADGFTYADLKRAAAELAETLKPISLPGLELSRLGRFVALTPNGAPAPLERLAERVTIELDPLRAPLDAAELERRRSSGLTPRQDGFLQRWGYPYVLDEFRFHLTLTGALAAEDAERALSALAPLVVGYAEDTFVLDAICLFADPGNGENFRQVDRLALTG